MKYRGLVPLVDDAHGHQQQAPANVESARQQEIDVRLLELEFAGLLETFDERVLHLELGDEANPGREAVIQDEHESVEVQDAVARLRLVEMKVHVA